MMFQALCNFGQPRRSVREHPKVPDLLTVEETADLLRLSSSKVYALVAGGELDAYSLGKAIRVPLTAILDFLERSKT